MAALPPVPKVVRLDAQYTLLPNSRIFNRFFLQYSGVLSLGDAGIWTATLFTKWGANVMPHQAFSCKFTSLELTDLSSDTAPQLQQSGSVAGGVGQAALGDAVAEVWGWETTRRYRGGHGRMYVPGASIAETQDGQNWLPASRANWQADANALLNALIVGAPAAAGTITAVTVSYFKGFTNVVSSSGRSRPRPTPRAVPLVDPIIAADVNPKMASQRRRNQQSL